MPDESRVFYRWLEQQWQNSGHETIAPAPFLVGEPADRGSRMQNVAGEIHELRERLLRREDAAAQPQGLAEEFRTVNVAYLRALLDEIRDAVDRAHIAEQKRSRLTEHYRCLFSRKDNEMRSLEKHLAEQQRRIEELERKLQVWPVRHASQVHGMVTRRIRGCRD